MIGVLVLLVPQFPTKVKEWAYAGFGITFISGAIAHISMNDPASHAISCLVFLGILIVSNIYMSKTRA